MEYKGGLKMFKKKTAEVTKRDLGFSNNESFDESQNKQSNKSPKQNKKSSNKKKQKNPMIIPKTVQDSIPYKALYKNGIIEIEPGIFTKSYALEDINFKIASDEEQMNIFQKYVDFLNSFDSDVRIQLVIYNRSVDEDSVREKIFIPNKLDQLNEYRKEYNNMLLEKMSEGKNNTTREKIITITLQAKDIQEAFTKFAKIDGEVTSSIKRINQQETSPMTAVERLQILSYIYSEENNANEFYKKANIGGKNVETFSFSDMVKQGLTTKDIIGPPSFKFSRDHFMIGNKYARSVFISNIPSFINANILSDVMEINTNLLFSINFKKLKPDKAMSLLKSQLVNINANVVDAQKRAAKSGYSPDLISPELLNAQKEAQELMDDITSRNQSLFLGTFIITMMEENMEDLNKTMNSLKSVFSKYLCQIKTLSYQQEQGLATSLPIGRCDIHTDRLLTTESAAIFVPFSTQELNQRNGMYYGLNAVSKNLLLFNRKNSKNANGVILGTPGSGKSFAAKREMVNVILNTDDDIYIIDPEREYQPLAALLGGQVIKIAAGSSVYLNPMDMDTDYGRGDDNKTDPIAMKCDFIGGLCETMAGDKRALSGIQKSIVDRCVRMLYQPYLEELNIRNQENERLGNPIKTCDTTIAPTLKEFYELLLGQPEYEAQSLALTLERFCVGSLDIFAHHTNVNTTNRFIVYDIKDIGDGLKELGLQVCLNQIWNQIIENKKKNKYTWFYIDEFYLLTQTATAASFLQQVYKRARKWQGIPTGITQNVGDLLASDQAIAILNNCEFIMMLNQSPIDKAKLAQMLNISQTQLSYITHSDPGQGLIYTGKTIVPFIDKFPTDTMLYRVMTTKPEDVADQHREY